MKGARPNSVTDAPAWQTGSLPTQQSGKRLDLVPARDDGLAAGRMEPEHDSPQVTAIPQGNRPGALSALYVGCEANVGFLQPFSQPREEQQRRPCPGGFQDSMTPPMFGQKPQGPAHGCGPKGHPRASLQVMQRMFTPGREF